MTDAIRVAAALVEDDAGRLLLVRKAGTRTFMQPGGKIEPGESAAEALVRELAEEIGAVVSPRDLRPAGRFVAPAANEPGRLVDAELFRVAVPVAAAAAAEIAALVWVTPADATRLPLAPLTRDHVLPLATANQKPVR